MISITTSTTIIIADQNPALKIPDASSQLETSDIEIRNSAVNFFIVFFFCYLTVFLCSCFLVASSNECDS